jgi:hypothetical protein
MDADQAIDFKIGNGEVYNLHTWTTNGGEWNYFVSFRPMALMARRNYSVTLSGLPVSVEDISPDLTPKDIKVFVNGQEMELISLQKSYETHTKDTGMPNCVVQVARKGPASFGKQTVIVEYDKEIEVGGAMARFCSMGLYQFYLNFSGLSEFF